MSENYFYSSLSGQEIEDTLLGSVRGDVAQARSNAWKAQARQNIGAGAEATGFQILGYYDTLQDLIDSLQVLPEPGDAYGIGTEPPYHIYVYDGTTDSWLDNGTLNIDSILDDNDVASTSTWSSQKISNELGQIVAALIDDTDTAADTTWSSNKINSELGTLSTAISNLSDQINTLSTDANTITIGKVELFKTDGSTLNTPYKQGLTPYQANVILSYASSANYAVQLALLTGNTPMYVRSLKNSTWTLWKPVNEWQLVWTNPSQSSSFAAKTVQIDLSGYSEVRIYATLNNSQLTYFDSYFGWIDEKKQSMFRPYNLDSTGQWSMVARAYTPSSTEIVFEDAYSRPSNFSSGAVNKENNRLVPIKIYAR